MVGNIAEAYYLILLRRKELEVRRHPLVERNDMALYHLLSGRLGKRAPTFFPELEFDRGCPLFFRTNPYRYEVREKKCVKKVNAVPSALFHLCPFFVLDNIEL